MKYILLLLIITTLACSAFEEHTKHSHAKKKHSEHHGNKLKHNEHYQKKSNHDEHPENKLKKHGANHENNPKRGLATGHGFKKGKKASETVLISLNSTQIKGTKNETQTIGTKFYHFQGIAYAKPPVGELRFEPPEPYEWEGTYDATYQRNICLQNQFPESINPAGSEDCLYLNVYTPSTSPSSPLSVLVWIHGGAFLSGSGNYETYPPDNFIDQNLVVVSLNYRLSVFGFLSTGDEVVPGNMGLKDQTLALKWVQSNIEYFGGDPKNVTIMGESAGGGSIAYLVQSPATKGLFQRAIAHSGNALCPWALSRRAADNTQLLARKNFIFSRNSSVIVQRLKTVDNRILLATATESMVVLLLQDPLNGLVYAPVKEVPNKSLFFSDNSYEQLSSCNLISVPLIIGYNSEEAKIAESVPALIRIFLLRYDLNPSDLVPLDMNVNTTQQKNEVGQDIRSVYFNDTGLVTTSGGLTKFISDDQFVRPTVQDVKLYSACEENVFFYRFSYSPDGSGVGHFEEMQYFFYFNKSLTADQKSISSKVVTMWADFIKTGNPTPNNNGSNFTWTASSKQNDYSYLDIGQEFVNHNQSTNPDKPELDQWTNWYTTYGNRPFDTY